MQFFYVFRKITEIIFGCIRGCYRIFAKILKNFVFVNKKFKKPTFCKKTSENHIFEKKL